MSAIIDNHRSAAPHFEIFIHLLLDPVSGIGLRELVTLHDPADSGRFIGIYADNKIQGFVGARLK